MLHNLLSILDFILSKHLFCECVSCFCGCLIFILGQSQPYSHDEAAGRRGFLNLIYCIF